MRAVIRLFPLLGLLLVGCASSFDVHRVPENCGDCKTKFDSQALFYALPATTITVDAAVEKSEVEDGQCQEFLTKDFLGVDPEEFFPGGVKKPSTKVTTVGVGSRAEPDPKNVYAIQLSRRWYQKITSSFALSELGLLTSADLKAENQAVDFVVTTIKTVAGLAVKTGLTAGGDPADANRPLKEKKCKQLQREIDKLRELRRQIIFGELTTTPPLDGPTITTMLDKIAQTEATLASKFVGAATMTAGTVHCELTPRTSNDNSDLFEIAKDGIAMPAAGCRVPSDLKSKLAYGDKKVSVRISTNLDEQFAGVAKDAVPDPQSPSGLVYRIPAISDVVVFVGDAVKAVDRRPVAQLGILAALPRTADVSTFQSNVKAALYPGTGAIQTLDFSGTPQGTSAITGLAEAATTVIDARAAATKAAAEAAAAASDELARLERMRKILEERKKITDLGGDPDALPKP